MSSERSLVSSDELYAANFLSIADAALSYLELTHPH